jgi:effector-binding domain-containing protein
MSRRRSTLFIGLCLATVGLACSATKASAPTSAPNWAPAYVPDLRVGTPPFASLEVNWKQRLDQPYVYLEHLGSYTTTGALLPELFGYLEEQSLQPSGPPFGLFYDDPGQVPSAQLVSRICVPVSAATTPKSPLLLDVLASTTVVYGFVGGPYPELARAYPPLFGYMKKMRWVEHGPIREIYLIPPGSVQSAAELVAEIQVPVITAQ